MFDNGSCPGAGLALVLGRAIAKLLEIGLGSQRFLEQRPNDSWMPPLKLKISFQMKKSKFDCNVIRVCVFIW